MRAVSEVSILLKAKMEGHLESLQESLKTLQQEYAFSLAPELVARVLREVGEA